MTRLKVFVNRKVESTINQLAFCLIFLEVYQPNSFSKEKQNQVLKRQKQKVIELTPCSNKITKYTEYLSYFIFYD
mgnify:CR=1 FL=1